jgi:hypothetical protein
MKSYGEILEGTLDPSEEEVDKLRRLLLNLCSSIDSEDMNDETYEWYLTARIQSGEVK